MNSDLLLCELHAHTTWSDGTLTLTELVDLYGRSGFDVLCVTDHALPDGAVPRCPRPLRLGRRTHGRYLKAVEREARRARDQYGLLVIPGLELTYDDPDPDESGHAVAVGLRSFEPLGAGLEDAMRVSRRLGAAVVAAHPHGSEPDPERTTRWFWRNQDRLDGLVDRLELFNRRRTFGWVATAGLPGVAAGDFHRLEHLMTWKTLLPCGKEEDAVVDYLRSPGRAYIVQWGRSADLRWPEAA